MSLVLCQIRMRPSQLKLSQVSDHKVRVTEDNGEADGEGVKNELKKVPAFVVTKIEEGVCKYLKMVDEVFYRFYNSSRYTLRLLT